jgi:hypothetical protein
MTGIADINGSVYAKPGKSERTHPMKAPMIALLSFFFALAAAAENPSLPEGTVLKFQRQLVLEQNRTGYSQFASKDFRDEDSNSCTIRYFAPPLSAPEIKEGRELEVAWKNDRDAVNVIKLVDPKTREEKASVVCENSRGRKLSRTEINAQILHSTLGVTVASSPIRRYEIKAGDEDRLFEQEENASIAI